MGQGPTKRNRTLAGPVQFVGAGADHHLPEGNNCRLAIAIWEDGQPVTDSNICSMPTCASPTTRRPACQPCGLRNCR